MDLDTQYITLLVVSIALTFLVGRLLITAGEPFLQEVFRDQKVTRSVNLLLSVLFHLITLGVLAIISGIDLGPDEPVQRFVSRLGVVLLVLGIAYGISMLVLIRVRERRERTRSPSTCRSGWPTAGSTPDRPASTATPTRARPRLTG